MSSAAPRRPTAPGWLILTIVCAGQFMVVLDVSVVNVALPSMRRDLHLSQDGLQWVVNAYTLAFAGFLLLGGRAADLYGRRRLFVVGLALFSLASLAGGLAANGTELVIARSVQGLGGAVLAPATLTILTTTFPEGPARSQALGVWSSVAAAGGAAGSLVGGVLTDLLSWRWILFVNVPIGLLAIVAARAVLVESRAEGDRRSLDIAGALTVTGGLVALVYTIVRTDTYAWTSARTLGGLAVAVLLLGAFVLVEARVSAHPLMPLTLFRSRGVVGGNLVALLLGSAMFAVWYFVSLYLQNVRGYSPLRAGFAFLPLTAGIAIAAQVASRLLATVGVRRLLVAGPLLAAVGLVWMSRLQPGSSVVLSVLLPGFVLTVGMGLSFVPMTVAGTSGVARADAGLASGLINTTRQVGGSLGLAALATLAADRSASLLVDAGSRPAVAAVASATTSGYSRAFLAGACLATLAAAAAFVIPARPGAGPLAVPAVAAAEPSAVPEPSAGGATAPSLAVDVTGPAAAPSLAVDGVEPAEGRTV